jgi:hypothetical protein
MIGLESDREVFARYKRIRAAEREYLSDAGEVYEAGRATASVNC